MDLKGQYAFEAPPATVWRRLMDPATIAGCLPGCERFEPAGEDRYQVVMTAGVAAISGRFEGSVAIADKQPESSYRLIVEGRGRPGFGSGEATVTLAPHDGGTLVDVAAVMTVGGLVAQVGQRLLASTARMMMDRFFKCLQSQINAAN
jgi:carbon monoxide dehydrogenase subunit G